MAACATNCSTSPHSLGYQTPTAFARTFNATADRLRNPDQLCDRPLLRGALAPISAGVTRGHSTEDLNNGRFERAFAAARIKLQSWFTLRSPQFCILSPPNGIVRIFTRKWGVETGHRRS